MKALTVNLGDRFLSAQEFLKVLKGVRDSVSRETRPLGTAVLSSTGSGAIPTLRPGTGNTQQRLCRFCYRPLPRMANLCPSCGEKN